MTLKKDKIISIFGIFILSFLIHFLYQVLPNTFTAMLSPVNESIWEHQKMLFVSVVLYGIIDYIILNKFEIKYNNFYIALFISAVAIIPIFLFMYLPIYFKIGQNMAMNIFIMFLAIVFSQYISYKILSTHYDSYIKNLISIGLIGVCFITFSYFTYYPIKTKLFFDTKEERYGINNYNI